MVTITDNQQIQFLQPGQEGVASPSPSDSSFGQPQSQSYAANSEYQVGFSGNTLNNKVTGSLESAIQQNLGKVAPGSPDANCAHSCMHVYNTAFGNGTAEKLGLNPNVQTSAKQMESNGLWQKITNFSNYAHQVGDIATSRNNGHMVISDGRSFVGSNESQRKTLDTSYYQTQNGNVDAIYRLVRNPSLSNIA